MDGPAETSVISGFAVSCYTQSQNVMFRFPPGSGNYLSMTFNATNSRTRPTADIEINAYCSFPGIILDHRCMRCASH